MHQELVFFPAWLCGGFPRRAIHTNLLQSCAGGSAPNETFTIANWYPWFPGFLKKSPTDRALFPIPHRRCPMLSFHVLCHTHFLPHPTPHAAGQFCALRPCVWMTDVFGRYAVSLHHNIEQKRLHLNSTIVRFVVCRLVGQQAVVKYPSHRWGIPKCETTRLYVCQTRGKVSNKHKAFHPTVH